MRLVVWNCNNGITQKAQIDYFKSLNADVAIIPELKNKNIAALNPDSSVWVTNNHSNPSPKGLGVLAFNGYKLEEFPRDEEMEIFIPVRVSNNAISFNLLAVWNFYSECKQGRFKDVEGDGALEYEAIRYYNGMLTDPCIVAGDWNLGPTFAQHCYSKIVDMLAEAGVHCLYHQHHGLAEKSRGPVTFKHSRGKARHWLDHIFGSSFFADRVKAFEIGDLDNVVLSDHAPLILDVELVQARAAG